MKIDIVIGNPPYQKNENAGANRALYNEFIDRADSLKADKVCFIIPMRWMTSPNVNGITPEWRLEQLSCNQYEKIEYWNNSQEVFGDNKIRGSLMILLKNRNHNGKCWIHNRDLGSTEVDREIYLKTDGADTFIKSEIERSILDKVINSEYQESFMSIVSRRDPFKLGNGDKLNEHGEIRVYANQFIGYTGIDEIQSSQEIVASYKLLMPKAFGGGEPNEYIPEPILAKPFEVCTETYLVISVQGPVEQYYNIANYMGTNLFRFLLHLRKSTQNASTEVYRYIPMQDFSQQWKDSDLYEKYNISQEEIEYIENKVNRPNK